MDDVSSINSIERSIDPPIHPQVPSTLGSLTLNYDFIPIHSSGDLAMCDEVKTDTSFIANLKNILFHTKCLLSTSMPQETLSLINILNVGEQYQLAITFNKNYIFVVKQSLK